MSRAREFADLAGSADAGGLTGRNLIINGAMQVAQRGTSETSVTSSQYANAPDRFKVAITTGGTWTVSQSTTSPDGFSNSYKFDCTAANGSLSSDSNLQLFQRIEGQNLQQLAKGTSAAKSVTVSFYVRTNKTGTYTLELFDRDNTRTFSKTYTVSSADTWEFKSVTFAGDTSGALDNDNAVSLDVSWYLAAGTDFTSGTFSSGWASKTDANRVSSSQVNLADSTSNEWYITGVQLEVGDVATAFEHRSYADELLQCQRYYQVTGKISSNYHVFPAQRFSSTKAFFSVPIATSMRADPTLGSNTTGNIGLVGGNGSSTNFALSAVSFTNLDASSITLNVTVSFTPNTGRGMTGYITTGSELRFDAEL